MEGRRESTRGSEDRTFESAALGGEEVIVEDCRDVGSKRCHEQESVR